MSALWSLTFVKTTSPIQGVFDKVKESFLLELDDKLYDSVRKDGTWLDVKTSKAITEVFRDHLRAQMIEDSLLRERYNRGVLIYPKQNGLFVLADSVIHLGHIYQSGSERRAELKKDIMQKPDKDAEALFLYMNFLRRLSKRLDAEMVHIMFERNPATRCTSIHMYHSGQFVDGYFCENIECEGRYGLVELPQKPDRITELLDGRVAFLTDQPRTHKYDTDFSKDVYFDGEDLSGYLDDPKWDIFNVRDSMLHVPFWEEEPLLPYGAVYCSIKQLPDYFLEKYKN